MGFYRVFANKQRAGDLIIRCANAQLIEDLLLPVREQRGFGAVVTVVTGVGNEVAGELLGEVALATLHAKKAINHPGLIFCYIENAVDVRPAFDVTERVFVRRIQQ